MSSSSKTTNSQKYVRQAWFIDHFLVTSRSLWAFLLQLHAHICHNKITCCTDRWYQHSAEVKKQCPGKSLVRIVSCGVSLQIFPLVASWPLLPTPQSSGNRCSQTTLSYRKTQIKSITDAQTSGLRVTNDPKNLITTPSWAIQTGAERKRSFSSWG